MCERGMGSAVGNEPKVLEEIARWAVTFAKTPVIVKLTPNIGDITEPGEAVVRSGAHAISLINTVKSIMGVDLDHMVPLPRVAGASTNGGYCGPAVKPIALHLLSQLARHPQCGKLPISGIGGIANWRDAAEFIALGSTSVQVCTAVMHYGYRIVEDMIEGLSDWLDDHGMKSVNELRGKAVPQYQEWGDLDLSYQVVADIDADKCIGCQLCYVACMDGAHQCVHLPGRTEEEARKAGHTHIPAHVPDRVVTAKAGTPGARVPYVDEDECIGCNLCALVCPVAGCISMREKANGKPAETWNDRVQKGTDFVPGGLEATIRARGR
jgi:dihydropyrimidine dehydrogenase (NAD+) subunit PreA